MAHEINSQNVTTTVKQCNKKWRIYHYIGNRTSKDCECFETKKHAIENLIPIHFDFVESLTHQTKDQPL